MSTARTCLGALAILTVVAALAGNTAWPARARTAGSMRAPIVARAFPISRPGASAQTPAISGTLVVWWRWRSGGGYSRGDIEGQDLATGRQFFIASHRAGQQYSALSAISGQLVVCAGVSSHAHLRAQVHILDGVEE